MNLGCLSKEAERDVIHDWLTKEGQAKGDTEPWILAMARESGGWAQHIMIYAQIAAQFLTRNEGRMTSAGLEEVMEEGRPRRKEYYRWCAHTYPWSSSEFEKLLKTMPPDGALLETDIRDALSSDMTVEKADKVFDGVVRMGILTLNDDGTFIIPAPFMRDYLFRKTV